MLLYTLDNMKKFSLSFIFLFSPFITFAQRYDQDLFGLGEYLIDLIKNTFLWLIFSLAIIFFLYNIFNYIRKPDKIQTSGTYILWGILALTVMFTVYGLIGLVAETFGLQLGIPQFFIGSK
jgi:hypothetical protein